MSAEPSLGLIVNTFNQPDYLARVLSAVARQTAPPGEVLLADDGSAEETRHVFAAWTKTQSTRAEHVWQPHEGFRRSRVLNLAIARTHADYLVFLDGDTVPHPAFLEDHRRLARAAHFLQGHRALIEQQGAAWFGLGDFSSDRRRALWQWQLGGLKYAFRWPRPRVRLRSDLRGIRGCNLGLWRADLRRVNGYNEAFVGWGREDSELAVRLMNAGVQRLDARGWALCYHLWHPPESRGNLAANDDLLVQTQRQHATRCALGLDQHLPPPLP